METIQQWSCLVMFIQIFKSSLRLQEKQCIRLFKYVDLEQILNKLGKRLKTMQINMDIL